MEKAASNQSGTRNLIINKPSCLLPTLTDLDERMKMLLNTASEEKEAGDTFAERAEWYYQKRPQLLALVQDLYNGYITLSNCCEQTKRKHKRRGSSSSQITIVNNDNRDQEDLDEEDDDDVESQIGSEAESTLSYQQPPAIRVEQNILNVDEIVADLVSKNVEIDMLVNQLGEMQQLCSESSRKIELLKKLVELLELERKMVLNENLSLGYKVTALLEEKRALSSEAMFMKRKAGELARCLLKMRDDQRVCILSRKIEHLQGQIYGLEKRNKEYYQQLVKRDLEDKQEKRSNSKNGVHLVALVGCFQIEKLKSKMNYQVTNKGGDGKRGSKWWGRVKKMDLFMCGLNPTS